MDHLAEVALGWLHWSEEQLFFSDLNSIQTGYAGMQTMLSSIFGEAKPANGAATVVETTTNLDHSSFISTAPSVQPVAPPPPLPPLTPADFDRMFPSDLNAKAN